MTQEIRPDDADPGKLFSDPTHCRQDLNLTRLGMRKRWPVSDEMKRAGLFAAHEILKTSKDERARIAAANFIAAVEGQNQRDELAAMGLSEVKGNTQVNNTQVNIYLPSNGRELSNGNGNGKH